METSNTRRPSRQYNQSKKERTTEVFKKEERERVRDFKTRIDDTYRIAYGVGAATSRYLHVVELRNETMKDVLLNGLKSQIADQVWNMPNVSEATYLVTVELAEKCKKNVKNKKIANNKVVSSAVTVISKENYKNAEEINNLKGLIQKLVTTSISEPVALLEEKTINGLNRLAI
jgi:hypothetical protein